MGSHVLMLASLHMMKTNNIELDCKLFVVTYNATHENFGGD